MSEPIAVAKSPWPKSIRDIAAEFHLPIPPGQMSEEKTASLIEIVFGCVPIKQYPICYRTKPRRNSYKIDYALPDQNVFVEYDGPDHYRDVFKIKRDEEKEAFFRSQLGSRLVRIPYWLQIQKGIAEFLFNIPVSVEQERLRPACRVRVAPISV